MKSSLICTRNKLIAIIYTFAVFVAGCLTVSFATEPIARSANLDGLLNQLVEINSREGLIAAEEFASSHILTFNDGRIRTEFRFQSGFSPSDVSSVILEKHNAVVVSASTRFLLLDIPVINLVGFANKLTGIASLHTPTKIYADVVSEGLALVGGDRMHGAGITGRNLDVAVIDIGFADWEAAQNRGELPQDVQVRNMTNEAMDAGSDHGTACAEIVYDFTSASRLHLLKIDDEADLENSLEYLLQNNIPVASMSLTWFVPQGDYYGGEDDFCQLVNEAADRGLLMVKSAGNYAKSHYRAEFDEENNDNLHHFDGETVNVFGTSAQRPRDYRAGEVIGASLVWDAFPVTALDYDLEIVRLNGGQWQRAAISNTRQNGNLPPTEELQFVVQQAGTYGLRVIQVNGAPVDFTIFANSDLVEYHNTSSIAVPAMAARALTVGAVSQFSWNRDPTPLQSYSSRGPTYDGRVKPDLVGPDAVSTWSKGVRAFSGTSASAPHGAGAALLIKSFYFDWSADQIKEYLLSTAIDVGDEGADNLFGVGKLNLTLGEHPEGQVIRVPVDVPSIGYAIAIADSLDTILVHPGTYYENLNTNGKAVVVGSLYLTTGDTAYIDSTVIDGDALGRVLTINQGETEATEIVGLTIANGREANGAGIYCDESNPTVRHCKIINNNFGGGIAVSESAPIFIECLISDNIAENHGGGVSLTRSSATFNRCTIRSNRANNGGGGLWSSGESSPRLYACLIDSNRATFAGGGISVTSGSTLLADRCVINANLVENEQGGGGGVYTSGALPRFDFCTFSGNRAFSGGAIRLYRGGNAEVTNSILWGDEPNEVSMSWYMERNEITISYCDVAGGRESVQIDSGNGDLHWGEGNIDSDPRFADVNASDFRLTWANYPNFDETRSPCIDAADPNATRDPDSTRADMGAFYFHHQALNAPVISVEPDTVWFNEIVGGDTLWGEVSISNYGDQPLSVTSIRIDSGEEQFGVAAALDTLEMLPSESFVARVFFFVADLVRLDYAGTLLIVSNDPEYGEVSVPLFATTLEADKEQESFPLTFGITGISPNPFNSTTVIRYELAASSDVSLSIHDVKGRSVKKLLIAESAVSGSYEYVWEVGNLPAGLYLVRIIAGRRDSIAKAVILK